MAARKIRQPPAEPIETPRGTGEMVPAQAPEHYSSAPARRLWLWPAVLMFAVWVAFLVTLAVRTANPVTLNRAQVRNADLVVEATVETLATGECRVVQSWPEAPQLGPVITIDGLADLAVRPGATYLLPLDRKEQGDGYRIAPAPPLPKPLIYPADEDARRQLAEILGNAKAEDPVREE